MGGDGLEAVGAEVAGEADAAALGWLPVEPAGEPGEERVEDRAVVGDDPPVPAEDAITGPQRDQGEDLARRRAADRGVVLGVLQPCAAARGRGRRSSRSAARAGRRPWT